MIRHSKMQRKYFFRKLSVYLLCITIPIVLLGTLLISHYRQQLQEELSSYAEQSRDYILYNVTSVLNIFSEQTLLFSSTPSLAHAISKLLNEETLDYKNSVYKNLISSILSTSANLSDYVDSLYIYFDNPYGNYFDSSKDYTSIYSPKSIDKEWFSIYENTPPDIYQWLEIRQMRYYSFQSDIETLSLFRRFHSGSGVMVINLNSARIAKMLNSNQIYGNSYTIITDEQGEVLFGSTGFDQLSINSNTFADVGSAQSSTTFDTFSIQGVSYIYFTSDIPDYNLKMISLIPTSSVFKTINSMVIAFTIILLLGILLCISLSFTITRSNFNQLQNLLNLFHMAERSGSESYPFEIRTKAKNEYDLIFNNIVQTFISNNTLQLNLAQAEIHQKDAQLAALQLQLNPHFIFNTLQTIDTEILRSHAIENQSNELIHNLSDILKYSLENTLKTVKIKDEIEICKTYAKIQTFRYDNPFILYFDYDEEILDEQIIHLLFQPLLENSLLHGIKGLSRKGLVKIKIYKRNHFIHIYIIDNGIGIDKKHLASIRSGIEQQNYNQTSHIGIYNTNLRLILTYGPQAKIHINSKQGMGTIVRFSIRMT